jgi:hypothetical protein
MFFVYDSTRVDGGCWILYRGYNSNDNTIGYQLRTNSQSLPMSSVVYRYRLLFTSADGAHYVPANNSTSTNATATRTVCQDKINPFGSIFYYGATASVARGSRPAPANLWEQYAIALGYSFNRTGAALTMTSWKPVYLKCAPQTDGSAIIDSTTPYVQDLPSTDDGKIYIFLGIAYSATNIELQVYHPVYWYKDGMIRPYTNASASVGSVAWGGITGTLSNQSDLNTALGTKANSADLATVATSGSYNDLTNKPTIPTMSEILDAVYPVGSIYLSMNLVTTSQVESLFGGTWVKFGEGKTLIGVDANDTDFDSVAKTGGSKSHTHGLTDGYAKLVLKNNGQVRYQERPVASWTDNYYVPSAGAGGAGADAQSFATNLDGSTNAGSTLQPYITCYMYKRTA